MSKEKTSAKENALVSVLYHGPVGQSSVQFGVLEPGKPYHMDVDYAAYLCERHPDYWKRPDPPPVAESTSRVKE